MKKKCIAILVICLVFMFSACITEDVTMQEERQYAIDMEFHSSIGDLRWRSLSLIREDYNHIIFACSERSFLEGYFPDDAIVAWPSLATYFVLERINYHLKRDEERIDLEALHLAHPLTMDDIVYNWKSVRDIPWNNVQINNIFGIAFLDRGRAMLPEFYIVVDILETYGIDVSEYGVELPLSREGVWANFSIIYDLFEKIDDDIHVKLVQETPAIMAEIRNQQRADAWEARQQ